MIERDIGGRVKVGIRRGRRVPTYDPNNTFYGAGLLLCFTFGVILAGIHESFLAGDWIWFWGFVTGEIGCIVLYFWNVWSWLKFPSLSDDYGGVDLDASYETWWSSDG